MCRYDEQYCDKDKEVGEYAHFDEGEISLSENVDREIDKYIAREEEPFPIFRYLASL